MSKIWSTVVRANAGKSGEDVDSLIASQETDKLHNTITKCKHVFDSDAIGHVVRWHADPCFCMGVFLVGNEWCITLAISHELFTRMIAH